MSEYTELKSRIDKLESRVEIERLIINYGKSTDASNFEKGYALFVSLFSDDCDYNIPQFGIAFKGNGDNAPVFDKDNPKKVLEPGGVGWIYKNWIFPGQEECFSLLGNIEVDVNEHEATGSDHMMRAGYKSPKSPDASPKDLEFTYAIHQYKFAKRNGAWEIIWFEGNPVHNTAKVTAKG